MWNSIKYPKIPNSEHTTVAGIHIHKIVCFQTIATRTSNMLQLTLKWNLYPISIVTPPPPNQVSQSMFIWKGYSAAMSNLCSWPMTRVNLSCRSLNSFTGVGAWITWSGDTCCKTVTHSHSTQFFKVTYITTEQGSRKINCVHVYV